MIRTVTRAFLLILATSAVYAFSLSSQTTRLKPLAVGESAPDFTLADHRGQKTTLSASRGQSPVVLVFYRGYW